MSGDVGWGEVGSVAVVKAKREKKFFKKKKNENHTIILKKNEKKKRKKKDRELDVVLKLTSKLKNKK